MKIPYEIHHDSDGGNFAELELETDGRSFFSLYFVEKQFYKCFELEDSDEEYCLMMG